MTVFNKKFETLLVRNPAPGVAHVSINRPDKLNAVSMSVWREVKECFEAIRDDSDVRAVVLTGEGRVFCAGLDLNDSGFFKGNESANSDVARNAIRKREYILWLQSTFSAVEKCGKPVIAFVHSACIGAGVDLITACDIRYSTEDAFFSVKEVDIGLAADIGTLQRLPKVVGNDSWVRELAYTARRAPASEALQFGLISRIFKDAKSGVEYAIKVATEISGKSPVAVVGTKHNLLFSRDNSVDEGLEHNASWNAMTTDTEDIKIAVTGFLTKKKPVFAKL